MTSNRKNKNAGGKNISLRQLMSLFILGMLSPMIRLPGQLTRAAGSAAWTAPVISIAGFTLLVLFAHLLFRSGAKADLAELCVDIFGKALGKIILSACFLWALLLASVYTRFYSEQILSSIMPTASPVFLTAVILLLAYFSARGGAVSLARLGEFLFNLFIVIFAVFLILAFFDVKWTNLLPVSTLDALPAAHGAWYILGIWAYFTFMFFLSGDVKELGRVRRAGTVTAIVCGGALTAVTAAGIGVLGPAVGSRVRLPFFVVLKNISFLYPFDRLDPVIISLWIIADFMLVTTFVCVAVGILKKILGRADGRILVNPVVIAVFPLSFFIARNFYELENLTERVIYPVNIALGFGLPLLLVIVGKIRKKI